MVALIVIGAPLLTAFMLTTLFKLEGAVNGKTYM